MEKIKLNMTVNGKNISIYIKQYARLLDCEGDLGLQYQRRCSIGECGAVGAFDGKRTTVWCCSFNGGKYHSRGLSNGDKLHPVQEAFVKQCTIMWFLHTGYAYERKGITR